MTESLWGCIVHKNDCIRGLGILQIFCLITAIALSWEIMRVLYMLPIHMYINTLMEFF